MSGIWNVQSVLQPCPCTALSACWMLTLVKVLNGQCHWVLLQIFWAVFQSSPTWYLMLQRHWASKRLFHAWLATIHINILSNSLPLLSFVVTNSAHCWSYELQWYHIQPNFAEKRWIMHNSCIMCSSPKWKITVMHNITCMHNHIISQSLPKVT